MLERARQPRPRDLMRPPADYVLPAKANLPITAIDPADAIERTGLTGTVGSDQREQLASIHIKRDAVEHGQAAKSQRQTFNLKFSHTISDCVGIASRRGRTAACRWLVRDKTLECPGVRADARRC